MRQNLPPGAPLTFWEYFDITTRAFAWDNHGKPGEPFGVWGYGMRALEIAGFALGGLIAPAILFAVPYCDRCQIYMRSKELGMFPAGLVPRKIKKRDTAAQEAYDRELQEAFVQGSKLLERLLEAAKAGNAPDFANLLKDYAPQKKEIGKLTARITLTLQHCRLCASGTLVARLVTGQGNNISTEELGRTPVDATFVRNLQALRVV